MDHIFGLIETGHCILSPVSDPEREYPPFQPLEIILTLRVNIIITQANYLVKFAGLRVREIAEQKKMSMGKLERLADLSHPTIRDIFRNPYKEVTSTTLVKLATALDVPVAELFEEVPDDRID